MTNRADIAGWLQTAQTEGATHLMVVYDATKNRDYPISVKPGEEVSKRFEAYNDKPRSQVMEVYALHLDFDPQLDEFRSFHFEYPDPSESTPWYRSRTGIETKVNEYHLPAFALLLREEYLRRSDTHGLKAVAFSSYLDEANETLKCEFWYNSKKIDHDLVLSTVKSLSDGRVVEWLASFVNKMIFEVAEKLGM